jgi:hypothetical protein
MLLSVRDAEQAAAQILPADVRDFIAGLADDDQTLALLASGGCFRGQVFAPGLAASRSPAGGSTATRRKPARKIW